MEYTEFLQSKILVVESAGFDVDPESLHSALFPFQRDLTRWAIRKGRAAIFADTGLGKTLMQLEWARMMPGKALIIAPLSVARQTARMAAALLNMEITYIRSTPTVEQLVRKIFITNYEMIEHIDFSLFDAVVLDESSILKAIDGKTRERLTQMCSGVRYKLCCTATPAPNDIAEIGNHSEFLGVKTMADMLAEFFVHDDDGYRLKGHGEDKFFRWLASWGMSVRKPSDIGDYSDDGYVLPGLEIEPVFVDTDYRPAGQLFATSLKGISGRLDARKGTMQERCQAAVELVAKDLEVMLQCDYGNQLSKHGVDNGNQRISQGIQQGLLRGEQGTRERAKPRILSSEQRKEKLAGEERIHAGVGQEEQGSYPSVSGSNEGQTKRSTQRALRPRRATTDSGKREGPPVAEGKQAQEKGPETKGLSDFDGGIPRNPEPSELQVRDLRTLRHEQSELLPLGGSLSRDGNGSRSSLHELQPGPGEVQGLVRSTEGSNPLFGKQWIIWCGLNDEQDLICSLLKDRGISFVSIYGSLSADQKEQLINRFIDGDAQVAVSKSTIMGYGLNLQCAPRQAFVGLGDSYEQYYQCLRRSYRFGQTEKVKAYIVLSEIEDAVYQNVLAKEKEALRMSQKLIENIQQFEKAEIGGNAVEEWQYKTDTLSGKHFTALLGDSAERMKELDDASIDLSVYSPPFMSLYTYSPSERDLGNSRDEETFFGHFGFIIRELLRVTKPGRLTACHVAQVPAMLVRDGYIGIKDFRGKTIQAFIDAGWIQHGEVVIDKDPQAQAIRTKAKSLLFVQLRKDSSWSRPALADFILLFRKPGENAVPIRPDISNDQWIEWARPIWYGIKESDTLQYTAAREDKDERHICPLQLGTIERCIRLWSNKGERVLSPFMGIGSEGYEAVRLERDFTGIELKESYWKLAVRNLREAEALRGAVDLFEYAELQQAQAAAD